jgi:predicted amidohydrolase
MKPYRVALVQQETRVIVDKRQRDDVIEANLARVLELIDWTVLRLGDVKLAMFSEYGIIGQFRPRSVEEWLEIAETIPGDVTEKIGAKAKSLGMFISGNLFERDPDWPGRLFNSSFIVSPEGKVILKYRKHNGPNNLNTTYTGPGDVYTEYVERHGEDAFFPVVDTEIGQLACMSCTDIVFPEMARAFGLKGAEVILHPTAEPYAPDHDAWDALRQARAYENMCYLLSCNAGAFVGSNRPRMGYRGKSMVVSPLGRIESIAEAPGEAVVTGTLDIEALRLERTRKPDAGHVFNSLVELRADLFAPIYQQAKRWPNDGWMSRKLETTAETRAVATEIIDRLIAEKKLMPPER